MTVLEFLIKVVLWQSIIDGGFVLGRWAYSWPGEYIGFEQELCKGLDPFVGTKDVKRVYE